MPDAQTFLDIIQAGGLLSFSLLAIYAFLTERIVPRSRLDEQREEKREAIALAKGAVSAMERLSDALEQANRLAADRLERRP